MEGLRLNVGSGDRKLPGFVNLDLEPGADVRWDVTHGLPFPDGTVSAIYSEHFIEHLDPAQGSAFLRECRRVLAPGGVVRLATPDLDHVVERYAAGWRDQAWIEEFGYGWLDNPCEMFNTLMREWGHRWVYNEEELNRLGRLAGLVPVGRREIGQSPAPELRGLEWRKDSRLIVEFGRHADAIPADAPLVSLLIPAYRPDFFLAALTSARGQTWRNLEILVSDDSPGTEIERMVAAECASDSRVRYVRNARPQGSWGNYARCLGLASGDFIKFLNDDDLLHPECVERMTTALIARPGATLAASRRVRIDARGDALPDIPETEPLARHDCVIEGTSLAGFLLERRMNNLGEPSTVLFRRADLAHVRPGPVSYGGRAATWNVDVAMWLNLLGQGDVVYFAEPLSFFRHHPGQESNVEDAEARAREAWDHMGMHARRLGLWDSSSPAWLDVRPLDTAAPSGDPHPELVAAMTSRALELSRRARHGASAGILRQVVTLDPGCSRAWLELGLSLYAVGEFLPAIDALTQAIELDPTLPAPMRTLAETLRRRVNAQPAAA